MIQLTIAPRGSEEIDLTRYMDVDEDPTPSSEHERDAFERAYGDVTLHLSNMDGYVEAILTGLPAQTTWDVIIRDNGRITFRGTVERPVSYSAANKWVTLKAFSKNKEFWERAKTTTIKTFNRTFIKVSDPYSIFSTVGRVVQLNCDQFNSDGIFSNYLIDDLYKNRPIRFAYESTDSTVRNTGRYEDLNPATTVETLLKAFALYYNAQFFIDPETNGLRMIRRNSIVNDTRHPLDDVIKSEDDIIYDDTDQKKYDYIKTVLDIPFPSAPSIVSTQEEEAGAISNTIVRYRVTNVIEYNGIYFESEPSDASATIIILDISDTGKTYSVNLNVPVGGFGVMYRNIYRWIGPDDNRLVGTIRDNITTQFVDSMPISEALTKQKLSFQKFAGYSWFRFDENINQWLPPIRWYDDTKSPSGKILDIIPKLSFVDQSGNAGEGNIFDIFSFFGREIDLVTFSKQWLDLFITKGKIKASVTETAYCVGDTFVSDRGFFGAGKFVVKKVTPHLFKKFSEVELIKA
jgi:hypothetical protein